jgi:hypothetical protein
MGWFRKHLNWTMVLIIIFAFVVSYPLSELIIKVLHITPYGFNDPPLMPPDVPNSGVSSTYGYLILTDVICIFGFSWVLIQKHNSLIYLSFFVPFLIFTVPTLLSSRLFIFVLPIYVFLFQFLSALICVAGSITLLLLKNKSENLSNS